MPDAGHDSLSPHESWQVWLGRHQAALALYARQFLASPQEAEDAVQNGFVRFWKSRQAARDPTAYLFACIRTAAIDLRRARQSRHHHEQAAASRVMLASPAELDDRRQCLEAALGQLPEDQREVLVLKTWSGLTFAQIAEALHIPANTAASRYRYALERLQGILSPEVTRD